MATNLVYPSTYLPSQLKDLSSQPHYTQFKIQVMEFCQINEIGWCASNVIKYVCRENKKDGIRDLYKAMDYLKCLIYFKENGTFLPPNKVTINQGKVVKVGNRKK